MACVCLGFVTETVGRLGATGKCGVDIKGYSRTYESQIGDKNRIEGRKEGTASCLLFEEVSSMYYYVYV